MSILLLKRKNSGPTIVSSGLKAYYRFSSGSGQALTDHSGGGHHGTLGSTAGSDTNDPAWTAEGLSFAVDDYVTTVDNPATRPDAWSVCAAVKFTPGVDTQPLVGWSTLSSSRPGVYLSFLGGTYRPLIFQGPSNFRYFQPSTPVNMQNNGWHFLVFRSPGVAAGDISNASLRVDGQTQATQSTTASSAADAKTTFRIGALGSTFLSGTIAFLTLHDRTLSDAEADAMRTFAKAQLSGRVALP